MTSIESLKSAILREFKERGKVIGEVISLSEWYDTILPNYAEAEQEMFMRAVSALQKEGKVEFNLGKGISLK